MAASASLVWFRHDLRLADNLALHAAVRRGGPIIPVYIWAPQEEGAWSPGAASRWWLHQSCISLDASLRNQGFSPDHSSRKEWRGAPLANTRNRRARSLLESPL